MRAAIATPAAAVRPEGAWPDVDVIMPIRNEAPHLSVAIDAVLAQGYPGEMRIVLAVGPSDDGTEALAQSIADGDERVLMVGNPAGITPAALNAAIAAGSAPVIVRVDGHSELSAGYVERAVETMRRTGAVNVGGLQVPVPTTPFEEAVAAATTSLLGTGGASYRVGGDEGPVDTVYLGVFDRAAVEAVGGFDDRLIRNQDYELNIRLRQAGGEVWFDPALSVAYRPRGSWSTLWRQYYEYGRWKRAVMRMHPESTRIRQVVPPLGIVGVASGLIAALRFRPAMILPATYAAALCASAIGARRLLVAPVLGCIHLAWATGFLGRRRR
ncbi:MAG: glycosyltransferase family 2 protein [Acidimicrobiia bacterium]|nr:glycosyltransferase family 2 protein [Acidimicrobiia bacterium]